MTAPEEQTDSMTHEQRRARRADIAKRVQDGATAREVAQEFGVSMSIVYAACDEHGVTPARVPQQPAPKTMAILGDLQANPSETLQQVADRHGVSRQRVGQILERARAEGVLFPGRRTRSDAGSTAREDSSDE